MSLPRTLRPHDVAYYMLDRLTYLHDQTRNLTLDHSERGHYATKLEYLQDEISELLATGLAVRARRGWTPTSDDDKCQKYLDAMIV